MSEHYSNYIGIYQFNPVLLYKHRLVILKILQRESTLKTTLHYLTSKIIGIKNIIE